MSDERKEVEVFEDEKKILLDHDYDGIRELDNPLPRWWVYSFYLTVIFGVPYYLSHTFFGAQTINESFTEEVQRVIAIQEDYEAKKGRFNEEEYKKVIANSKTAKIARKTYKRKCAACHAKDGGGSVGPNLTDNFWINGDGSIKSKYDIINKGIVENGMPAWGAKLGKEKVYAVLSYIEAFKGTTPKIAKDPQGKEYK